MKKNLSILLSSFALISLISCNAQKPSSHSNSKIESSTDSASSERSVIASSNPTSSDSTSNSNNEGTYYHVTFVNYDDTVLYEVDVLEGSEAVYSGVTPIRPDDEEFKYEFTGWDQDLTNITSSMTTKAIYKEIAKEEWGSIIWF